MRGYIDFCRDAGWELVSQLKNGICIFVSRDGRGKPLHTDETVKYDHILKVISERHLFKGQAANVIKLIAAPLAALLGVFLQGTKRNADVGCGLLISGIILYEYQSEHQNIGKGQQSDEI